MTLVPDSQHVRCDFNFGTSQICPYAIIKGDQDYNQYKFVTWQPGLGRTKTCILYSPTGIVF